SLLTGCGDGTVRQWDVVAGQERRRFAAHAARVNCLAVINDGQHLLSGGDGEPAVKLWDLAGGQLLVGYSGGPKEALWVAADRDGRRIAAVGPDGMVQVWDQKTGQPVQMFG